MCDNKEKDRGDVLVWHTPSSGPHMDPLLREKAIREVCMHVFYDVGVCVRAKVRPVHQPGNRGHINLICHNLSLETPGPPVPVPTHPHTLTPSCVLSVSAADRESEANYMWELRRWKRDKDPAGVCVRECMLLFGYNIIHIVSFAVTISRKWLSPFISPCWFLNFVRPSHYVCVGRTKRHYAGLSVFFTFLL